MNLNLIATSRVTKVRMKTVVCSCNDSSAARMECWRTMNTIIRSLKEVVDTKGAEVGVVPYACKRTQRDRLWSSTFSHPPKSMSYTATLHPQVDVLETCKWTEDSNYLSGMHEVCLTTWGSKVTMYVGRRGKVICNSTYVYFIRSQIKKFLNSASVYLLVNRGRSR